jgi:hypothetical protein
MGQWGKPGKSFAGKCLARARISVSWSTLFNYKYSIPTPLRLSKNDIRTCHHACLSVYGANRLIDLSRGPYSRNSTGIGTMTAAIQPRSVPAHWIPRLLNIWRVKSGKQAPTMERIIVFAAKAEAALIVGLV